MGEELDPLTSIQLVGVGGGEVVEEGTGGIWVGGVEVVGVKDTWVTGEEVLVTGILSESSP